MTLVHVLATVPTHARVGWDRRTAARALKGFCGGLVILIEICKFNHQVWSHDGQGQINLHFRLPWGELDFFGFVPTSRSGKERNTHLPKSHLLPPHKPNATVSAQNLLCTGWMESSSRIHFLSFCIDMICSQKYILSCYPLHRETV